MKLSIQKKKLLTFLLFLNFGLFVQAQPLDFYLKKGMENSPLLKDFSNQVRSGTIDSLLTRAALKPQINQVTQALYSPSKNNLGYDEAITNGGNYAAVVNFVQPLLTKAIKAGQFRDIELNRQSTGVNARITENDLKQGITAQYLTAYANFLQIEFNQTILQLLKQEKEGLIAMVNKGVYLQTDLLNISISITNQDIAIQQATLQYKNSLALLNFLCGIHEASTASLEKPEIFIRSDFDIRNTPSMVKFRIDSLKNINSRFLIDLNYRPKLNAYADAGFMAVTPENIPHNFGASIGLNFTVPVYDGKQRKLQYDKTFLAENTRTSYKAFYESQFKEQIIQLTEQIKLTDQLIASISSQLKEQEKLIDIYKIEINKGLVRFLDFLTIVNNYSATRNNLTITEMNRLQLINQLNYLK